MSRFLRLPTYLGLGLLVALAALLVSAPAGQGAHINPTVIATVPVDSGAGGVAVNPTTNRIYVANFNDGTVSVIDGALAESDPSNAVTATVTVGVGPRDIGVNPTTDRVYVSNGVDGTVSVIDGALAESDPSNAVTATVTVGVAPGDVGVNPTTNRVYVVNFVDATVSVIDGALAESDPSNAVIATVPVVNLPAGVAVNPTTNRVYVGFSGKGAGGPVLVIDGALAESDPSNAVIATVTVGVAPGGVGVNPTTNRVYVANFASASVSVIDGALAESDPSNAVVATVTVGGVPSGVGVNPTTNRVYVTNPFSDLSFTPSNTVSVIDGALTESDPSNAVVATVTVGGVPRGVGVNPSTDRVYVINANDDTVSVINGQPPSTITLKPETATNTVGEDHKVTANVTDGVDPVKGVDVTFTVIGDDSPNKGDTGTATTVDNGDASFTYTGDGGAGIDTIQACFVPAPAPSPTPTPTSTPTSEEIGVVALPVTRIECASAEKTWAAVLAATATPAPTATATPAPVVLPTTGGEPAGGSGALPWLALSIGALIVTSGGLALAYQRRRIR